MKLSYKADLGIDNKQIKFPLGDCGCDSLNINQWMRLGSIRFNKSANLSEAQVLAILGEVIQLTNAKIKVEFEEGVTLEFE